MNRNLVGSLPASMQPSRHFSKIISIFDSGAPTVMSPSAYMPVFLAVTGPAVAMRIGGGSAGIVHSRVVSSLKYLPSCLTSLPLNSLRMISIASNIRAIRSGVSGQ